MNLLESSPFCLLLSFSGFIALFFYYAYQPLVQFLDRYIDKIESALRHVKEKKEKASQLLHQENLKLLVIEQEIAAILTAADQKCDALRNNMRTEILEKTKEQDHRLKVMINKMNHDFSCQLRDQISEDIIQSLNQWVESVEAHQNAALQEKFQKKAILLLQGIKQGA